MLLCVVWVFLPTFGGSTGTTGGTPPPHKNPGHASTETFSGCHSQTMSAGHCEAIFRTMIGYIREVDRPCVNPQYMRHVNKDRFVVLCDVKNWYAVTRNKGKYFVSTLKGLPSVQPPPQTEPSGCESPTMTPEECKAAWDENVARVREQGFRCATPHYMKHIDDGNFGLLCGDDIDEFTYQTHRLKSGDWITLTDGKWRTEKQ